MTHSYHPSLSTEKSAGILEVPKSWKSWKSWSLPVVLSIVFLLLGLWIGAVTAPAPVGYVGMSESGAKIVLAPVPKDSAVPGFMWKHGDTRTDPVTGNQLKLNVQNWVPVKQEPTRTATPRTRKTSLPDWMLDSSATGTKN